MLVDYSDSESESEQQKNPTPPPPSPPPKFGGLSALLPKPKGVQKNAKGGGEDNGPKKFIVNLPKVKNEDLEDEPPAKKARIGGGSGLGAMLPAPKRSGAAAKNAPPPPPEAQEFKDSSRKAMEEAGEDMKKTPPIGNGFVSVASSTRFVPQSVARKPIQPTSSFKKQGGPGGVKGPAAAKTKVSLFGSGETTSLRRC